MAEHQPQKPQKSDPATDKLRAESAAESAAHHEEREALKKAREAEIAEYSGEGGEAAYANLHYGDRPLEDDADGVSPVSQGGGTQQLRSNEARSASSLDATTQDNQQVENNETPQGVESGTVSKTSDPEAQRPADSRDDVNAQMLNPEQGETVAPQTVSFSAAAPLQRAPAENELDQPPVGRPVNEAPTDIALSDDAVAENDAGAVVATLTASDPDFNDAAVFSLEDDPSGLFEIVDGQLKLKDGVTLDHEAQDVYQLTIAVEDEAGNRYTETVSINVTDINETPTDIQLSRTSVDENNAG
ncbi:MAG: cadherin repeat domain-containing protein, partial [Hyphococcus sp.]